MNSDKYDSLIDGGRYDRQERVLGKDAMKKLVNQKILLVGLGGTGVEVAKNLILMGVTSLTLYDDKDTTSIDLASQFCLKPESIGKNRATESIEFLRALNDHCNVDILKGQLDEKTIVQFTMVIVTDKPIAELVELNEICRKHDIMFIASECRGVFGAVFVDFGKEFVVYDVDGEPPAHGIVNYIKVDKDGIGHVNVEDPDNPVVYNIQNGDYVVFSGVGGMTELNDGKPRQINNCKKFDFTIGDVSGYSPYTTGGYFTQVKMPVKMSFKSLKENLKQPEINMFYHFGLMERPHHLHVCFQALGSFVKKYNRYPQPYHDKDAEELIKIAIEINDSTLKLEDFEANMAKLLAYTAQGQLNPMTTFLGGLVAQEAQKGCTSKFKPINQFFYFECTECLPDPFPTTEDCKPTGSRYDGQILVFGSKIHRKITNQKYFLVGAGALGCEFLKNFAMIGLGCGPAGKVTVTDMDSIEISNLSRQFLFRKEHVGKMKSDIAAKAAHEMNKELNVHALQDRVGPETENIFDDRFWELLDGVTNALDNIEARRYVDGKCVYYRKPLLESGTLGTQGNVQVIIPFQTESYSSTRDPETRKFPTCTIHSYPNVIEHTIAWAKGLFDTLFQSDCRESKLFLSNPKEYLETKKDEIMCLESVHDMLIGMRPKNFNDCIAWARIKFEELFIHQIKNVLHHHPPDEVTKSGAKFWSGNKRCPKVFSFDINDPTHLQFIIAAARLLAEVYGIKPDDKADIEAICKKAKIPEFRPSAIQEPEDKEQQEDKNEKKETEASEEERKKYQEYVEGLIKDLSDETKFKDVKINEIEFEKDDDTNFHMDFITAASNLRARAYGIPEADKHSTKGIAGNIIPAMITTTALITGLVCFELYKVIQHKKAELCRNSFVNLALPFMTMSEPVSAKKCYSNIWTLWDRFDISEGKDITIKELCEKIKKEHNLDIVAIQYYSAIVWHFMWSKGKKDEREKIPIGDLLQKLMGKKFPKKQKYVELNITAMLDGKPLESVPPVKLQFRFPKKKKLSRLPLPKKKKTS